MHYQLSAINVHFRGRSLDTKLDPMNIIDWVLIDSYGLLT